MSQVQTAGRSLTGSPDARWGAHSAPGVTQLNGTPVGQDMSTGFLEAVRSPRFRELGDHGSRHPARTIVQLSRSHFEGAEPRRALQRLFFTI